MSVIVVTFMIFAITLSYAAALAFMPGNGLLVRGMTQRHAAATGFDAFSGIDLDVVLRNDITLTDTLANRIDAKIGSVVSKFGEGVVLSTTVTLRLEPQLQICDVVCKMKRGGVTEAKEAGSDMYASIDAAAKTLTAGLKRHREKVQDHRHNEPVGGLITEDEEDEIMQR